MKFLYPAFLIALSTVIIPVIIHLFNFRKYKRVIFSNVRFLREVNEESTSRNRLKHLLVLISRILFLSFLVFAFAQPFIPYANTSTVHSGNLVSMYIDNSFSMESQNEEGVLFDQARKKAKEICLAYKPDDRFQLLTNDFEAKHQRWLNRDAFIAELDQLKISASAKTLKEVIARQRSLFESTGSANKHIYILSDFQRSFVSDYTAVDDSSVLLRFITFSSAHATNVSIDSVYFTTPVHQSGQEEQLIVRISNHGSDAVENMPLKLLINNEQRAIGAVSIPANESRLDTLKYKNLKAGWQNGSVELADQTITFDDRYYFSYEIKTELRVLIINGSGTDKNLENVFRDDPYFKLNQTTQLGVDFSTLSGYGLIILNEPQAISSGLAEELQKSLSAGSNIIFIPSFETDPASYNTFLSQVNADPLKQVNVQENSVSAINLKEGTFDGVFEKMPSNIDLPKVKQYYALENRSRSKREMVMIMKNGDGFIVKYPFRAGRFYLLTTSLKPAYSNFSQHALFVPFILRAGLNAQSPAKIAYEIGADNRLTLRSVTNAEKNQFKLVGHNLAFIPDIRNTADGSELFVAGQISEAGLYRLQNNGKDQADYSFNYNRAESKMDFATDAELRKLLHSDQQLMNAAGTPIAKVINLDNFGLRLWKICVILALVFLGFEVLLLRFGDRFLPSK